MVRIHGLGESEREREMESRGRWGGRKLQGTAGVRSLCLNRQAGSERSIEVRRAPSVSSSKQVVR